MLRRLPWIALALAASCSRASPTPPGIQSSVVLHRVEGCPAVEAAVQDAAVVQMRQQLENYLHWDSWGVVNFAGGGAVPASAPAPAAYTTTNVQVNGVDEPDFVKNDGTRIFVLSGQKLYAANSWPPADLQLASGLLLEGYPTGMFLDATGRIAVISQVPPARDPQAGMGVCPAGMGFGCGYFGPMLTKVTLVDARDAKSPAVTGEIWLPGSSWHARRLGSRVHLVLSDLVRWPEGLQWWPRNVDWQDQNKFAQAIHELEDANEKVIRATPLASWLPPAQRKIEGGAVVDVPYDCAQFHVGNAPVRLGFATVATLDLDHPEAPPARATILGEAGMIYASQSSLYLASYHFWWWNQDGNRDWTYLHRFDLSQPGGAAYLASGGFEGHPVNQFSLDESGGYLRAAVNSMKFQKAEDPRLGFRLEIDSALRVVATEGKELTVVAQLDLAPGEWVRSSRFLGDRGFVVTFKNIDPLFALDLKDPKNPRKAGVLELPGFSTYLQPTDDQHLLAIGVDLPENSTRWQDRALQLSVFDVSDLSAPRRTAQARIGSAWAYSEALWDHHAFTWFPEKKLLAVPFFDWSPVEQGPGYWNSFSSDLRVFEVGADSIVPKGALSMKDLFVTYGNAQWKWSYSPAVRRGVMASNSAGDTWVYAVSDGGIRVAPLASLASPLATAAFPQPQ